MRSTKLLSWIEELLGLDPQLGPPNVFTVGRERLALARVEPDPEAPEGGHELVRLEERPLGVDFFLDGPLGGPAREPSHLREAIAGMVADLEPPEVSLVLPDRWLRMVITEVERMPRRAKERAEILSWKLRKLVPFRVEELRVRSQPLPPLVAGGPPRALLAFAVDVLLEQLESAFESAGVKVGHVTSETLALMGALARREDRAHVELLSVVHTDGYTLTMLEEGRPVLHRYKVLDAGAVPADALERMVRRELQLTIGFLTDRVPGSRVDRAFLVSVPEHEAEWLSRLEDAVGEVVSIDGAGLGVHTSLDTPWHRVAPMVATALEEVA